MTQVFHYGLFALSFCGFALVTAWGQAEAPVVSADDVKVVFTHGPNGPVRTSTLFYPDSPLTVYLRLPGSMSRDGDCRLSIAAQLESREAGSRPIRFIPPGDYSGILTDKDSPLQIALGADIPLKIEPGKYDLVFNIYDELHGTALDKRVEIEIGSKDIFAVRDMMFTHHAGDEAKRRPGGNVFWAGNSVGFVVYFGGMAFDGDEMMRMSLTAKLIDSRGQSRDLFRGNRRLSFFQGKREDFNIGPSNTVHFNFHVTLFQPGEYFVEFEATDENAEAKGSIRLPLTILGPGGTGIQHIPEEPRPAAAE